MRLEIVVCLGDSRDLSRQGLAEKGRRGGESSSSISSFAVNGVLVGCCTSYQPGASIKLLSVKMESFQVALMEFHNFFVKQPNDHAPSSFLLSFLAAKIWQQAISTVQLAGSGAVKMCVRYLVYTYIYYNIIRFLCCGKPSPKPTTRNGKTNEREGENFSTFTCVQGARRGGRGGRKSGLREINRVFLFYF